MFITRQNYDKLIGIMEAAKKLVAEHPGEYYPADDFMDASETRCRYCNELEVRSPDADEKEMQMQVWLAENPQPVFYQQTVKRKNAPDMQEWDRENSRRHTSYNIKFGMWQSKYRAASLEIFGDPATHPCTVINHKEDCLWLILKNSLA